MLINLCLVVYRLGGNPDNYPHPEGDIAGFKRVVDNEALRAGLVWNPSRKVLTRWVDTSYISGSGGGCAIC